MTPTRTAAILSAPPTPGTSLPTISQPRPLFLDGVKPQEIISRRIVMTRKVRTANVARP